MPLGLIALVLRYLFLAGLLGYVVWVLRAMMEALPAPVREDVGVRSVGRVAPRQPDKPSAVAGGPPATPERASVVLEEAVAEPAAHQAPEGGGDEPLHVPLASATAEPSAAPWPPEPQGEQAVLGAEEPRLPLEVAAPPRTRARKPARKPGPAAPRRLAGFELLVEEPGRSSLLRGQTVPLRAGLHIGRAADNGLVIDDPTVSRQHAYLGPRGDGWVLVDKGSVNGTFVNGERLRGSRELTAGDLIQLGAVRLVFRRAGGASPG